MYNILSNDLYLQSRMRDISLCKIKKIILTIKVLVIAISRTKLLRKQSPTKIML